MTTLARLQTILMNNYPVEREALAPDTLLEKLDIDSLGVMELFFSIEDEFKLNVPNDKTDLKTIGDVVAYIDQLMAEQHDQNTIDNAVSGTAP